MQETKSLTHEETGVKIEHLKDLLDQSLDVINDAIKNGMQVTPEIADVYRNLRNAICELSKNNPIKIST